MLGKVVGWGGVVERERDSQGRPHRGGRQPGLEKGRSRQREQQAQLQWGLEDTARLEKS